MGELLERSQNFQAEAEQGFPWFCLAESDHLALCEPGRVCPQTVACNHSARGLAKTASGTSLHFYFAKIGGSEVAFHENGSPGSFIRIAKTNRLGFPIPPCVVT
jgi:hypothetical protein